jgi:hypothetical protein
MGFPSAYSDTSWMYRRECGDPMDYILGQLAERAEREEHMPLMLHDWVAWLKHRRGRATRQLQGGDAPGVLRGHSALENLIRYT